MPRLNGPRFGGPPREKGPTPYPGTNEYRNFGWEGDRKRLYQTTAWFTEYLHENKAANVIFIDRSARPAWVGVHELWKHRYADEPRPGLFFINPDVFNGPVKKFFYDSDPEKAPKSKKLAKDIGKVLTRVDDEFKRTYAHLLKDPHAPLVLFDTCSHTGRTVYPVVKLLEAQGFTNIKVVTAGPPDYGVPIEPIKYGPAVSCVPFGYGNSGVDTGIHSVLSTPQSSKYSARTSSWREIRQIIRDEEAKYARTKKK
ncbi:hypothetical protein K2Y00_04020 [Patescibacteria group bacterium]|nr:hypothetical protein [Patescibacteria group bacterium]